MTDRTCDIRTALEAYRENLDAAAALVERIRHAIVVDPGRASCPDDVDAIHWGHVGKIASARRDPMSCSHGSTASPGAPDGREARCTAPLSASTWRATPPTR
jgi:hypothetical protein